MGYWIMLIIIFIFAAAAGIGAYLARKENDGAEFKTGVVLSCVFAVVFIYFCLDIPDAVSGGQKIYVNGFPKIVNAQCRQIIYADGRRFVSFNSYRPEKYEQEAVYCVSYTRFTKSVLNIEEAK